MRGRGALMSMSSTSGKGRAHYYVYCDECGTPVAELIGGRLVILSHHHSERHMTVITPPVGVQVVIRQEEAKRGA